MNAMTGTLRTTDHQMVALVVDDEPGMCWALSHLLKEAGVTSVTANSGQEAIRLVSQERFHLAFLDAKLPDVDWRDLAQRIREANAGIILVLISGYYYRDDPEVIQASESGIINSFLGKPFLHAEVRNIAQMTLASRADDRDR